MSWRPVSICARNSFSTSSVAGFFSTSEDPEGKRSLRKTIGRKKPFESARLGAFVSGRHFTSDHSLVRLCHRPE
jgi:hypothetical protein